MPDDDRLQLVGEHDAENFWFDATYLGIDRTDDLVIIRITLNEGRTVQQKKWLYAAIAEALGRVPSVSVLKTSLSILSKLKGELVLR